MPMYLKCFFECWKDILKPVTFARNCAILPKYGVFKILYLTIETGYHLFDTFSSKTKHNTFV